MAMQKPTLQNMRIRSTRDALQVFYGVATGRLPLITRRLDAEERRNILPGNVYVWEERGANTEPTGLGMERWTDGMGWGPSRVRDEFLFYHQKDSDLTDDLVNPVTPWAQMMKRSSVRPNGSRTLSLDGRAVVEAERLIKQTYSVHVSLPSDRPGVLRKWHLTAYFSPSKMDELDTIDNQRGIGDAQVPSSWFKSARAGRGRRDSRTHGPNLSIEGPSQLPPQHPSSYQHPHHKQSPHSHNSVSPTSTLRTMSSSPTHSPHQEPLNQLVPLEVLVRTSGPRRDPVDEQLLRRFAS
ncbi:hypothetical protein CVT24_007661 [Panaeolus cyanescens]|uniref:cAMP-independent regulatory protein pac2 n=1 Tax=Panaeolus cyanescens TaxID=181874 RepID=A0A409VRQ7_9AGAR|nr:hypothetical protein CVT24_007661 [Panaeolus cyanescens]